MVTTFLISLFMLTTNKETFSKISSSLDGKYSYTIVIYIYIYIYIYIINNYLNK